MWPLDRIGPVVQCINAVCASFFFATLNFELNQQNVQWLWHSIEIRNFICFWVRILNFPNNHSAKGSQLNPLLQCWNIILLGLNNEKLESQSYFHILNRKSLDCYKISKIFVAKILFELFNQIFKVSNWLTRLLSSAKNLFGKNLGA